MPWILFGIDLLYLQGPECAKISVAGMVLIIIKGVLPALAPFGLYRVWLAIVQGWPHCFYASRKVPRPVRRESRELAIHGTFLNPHLKR